MNLREMIEAAETKVGGTAKLGQAIGIHANSISNAKAGARGLPDEACLEMAKILNIELGIVIAARNAAIAKTQVQRDFWLSFLDKAATVIMTLALGLVTLFVSPTPASASTGANDQYMQCALCQIQVLGHSSYPTMQ